MGIVNLTPDSFSGDGVGNSVRDAVALALKMQEDGAAFIDLGGESTRPGALPVPAEQEAARVLPVVEKLAGKLRIPISVDTYKAQVAEKALDAGAQIVNDITALCACPEMASIVADRKASVVLMHMQGTPQTMQANPSYKSLVPEIRRFLGGRARHAVKSGIRPRDIALDPGIGFGKTAGHNLEIIRRMGDFGSLGYPVLAGPSRKSFIGQILDLPPGRRLEGTLAAVSACVLNGADIVRVHDVRESAMAARVAWAVREGIVT